LDSEKQEAAVETARREITETEAALLVARADIQATEGQIQEAKGAYQQAADELRSSRSLSAHLGNVALRDIEKLQVAVEGAIDSATAAKQAAEHSLAEKASAEAALAQAQAELEKTAIRAGVDGGVQDPLNPTSMWPQPISDPAHARTWPRPVPAAGTACATSR
jgi:multidrug resistance efflux pump